MTSDGTNLHPSSVLPAWLPLSEDARRRAWELGQNAPAMDEATRAAVALLVRPVAPLTHPKAS